MTPISTPTSPPAPLPQLRPELRLLQGAATLAGEPTWLIHDPLSNRFIQIDRASHDTLRHWRDCTTTEQLLERVRADGRISLDAGSLAEFVTFLQRNELTLPGPGGSWRALAAARSKGRGSAVAWLVHNYLFFRVPLWRPQRFLERTLPIAAALSSRTSRLVLAALGLIGLYLVARQWDAYIGTFQHVFNWDGALLMLLGLSFVKAAHELGHAYTAVGHGCRVHSMGVAFVVMAPLLYTDVTDSWRLGDRRKRLAIDSAGIATELGIASLALFLWPFMPDGPLRSLAFVLSAVGIASSLAINLNPFMRFDGYYLLSELLGVENLQARAFELARWKLREWLFGLGAPPPEVLPRHLARVLVAYAWATWIYRLFVFVGIALVVYHYFFKVLGVVLFLVEIAVFIARPVWSELRMWHRLRNEIRRAPHTPFAAAALVALVLAAVVPWSASVEIPAVVESAALERVFPPRAARIERVHVVQGARVAAGAPLATLSSTDIDRDLAVTRTRLRLAELQHGRRLADRADLEDSAVLEGGILALRGRIAGLEAELEELVIRAPIAGEIVELNPQAVAGRWIGVREPLAVVAGGDGRLVARGYVAEPDLWRLGRGSTGRFFPDHAQRAAMTVAVEHIAPAGAAEIEIPELASTYSGRIAVTTDAKRRLLPTVARYMVRMSVAEPHPKAEITLRGVVVAEGARESLASRLYRQAMQVLVREGGA